MEAEKWAIHVRNEIGVLSPFPFTHLFKPATAVFAMRTNRCISSNLGPGADLTNLAFNSVAGLFMAIQTNTTHFVTGMCQDAACQNCQFATRTLPSCVAGVITSSGGTQGENVIQRVCAIMG